MVRVADHPTSTAGTRTELGLYVDARVDIADIAVAAERTGFGTLWVYDSPLVFADTTTACVLALQATTSIAVGPGVATPRQRPAVWSAQLAASLDALAPGRVVYGLGTGNSAARSLAQRPATMTEVVEHARTTGRLVQGETVPVGSTPIRLMHQRHPWVRTGGRVPIWVSAFGPVGRRAAAAVADGILVRWEGPEALMSARQEIAEGASKAGRDPADVSIGVVTMIYPIESDGELDSEQARRSLGPLVISRLRYLVANEVPSDAVPAELRDGVAAYRAHLDRLPPETRHLENYYGYLVFVPEELEALVTPEAMRGLGCIGEPSRVAGELALMRSAGVDHVSLQMAGDHTDFCRRLEQLLVPECPEFFRPSARVEVDRVITKEAV